MIANNRRVTIADVARKAGVSPTAVSFAFNKPSQLSSETVGRILAAAAELGYTPNPLAKALLSGRVGVVGVLLPQSLTTIFANPYFSGFLQGMGSVCDEKNFSLLVTSPLESASEESLEKPLSRAPVDGFVIVGHDERHQEVLPLIKRNVPVVIVDGDAETVSSVNVDDQVGAYQAVSYLLDKGATDLRIITFEPPYGHLDNVFYGAGSRRLRGCQQAFEERGIAWSNERLVPAVANMEGGEQAFTALWETGARPEAILAFSDAMALGVINAAVRQGLRVPDDLEVIGFDDIPLASLSRPALSTVRQPAIEKGRMAVDLLMDAIENKAAPQQVMLPTELILRETTRV